MATGGLFEEREPALDMEPASENNKHHRHHHANASSRLCSVEELCNISVGGGGGNSEEDELVDSDDVTRIELSRKSGIPVYLKMGSRQEALSFLSHLSGYYR